MDSPGARSAIPDALAAFARRSQALDDELAGRAYWFQAVFDDLGLGAAGAPLAADLTALAEAGRRLTAFVLHVGQAFAAAGGGDVVFLDAWTGRAAYAVGDLTTAEHVAVIVPGMGTTLADAPRLVGDAARLRAAAEAVSPAADDTAVVAWLGYDTPGLADVASPVRAERGADALAAFAEDLAAVVPAETTTTVIGHSYGSLVASLAMLDDGLRPDNAVFLGSPGVMAGTSYAYGDVDVYAARAAFDFVGMLEWFGPDPAGPGFGATRFSTDGAIGHGEYFDTGTASLLNLALITVDQGDRVLPEEPD